MKFRKYTDAEGEFIRKYAYGHSYKDITDEFNRQFQPPVVCSQIRAYLRNHQISTGRTGRSQFKKGNIPVNHKPVGTESVRSRKNRREAYVWVKVAEPNQWRMKHVLVWEEHNGAVPAGKIITFLDSNPLNTDISNLVLIDRKTNARLNQMGLRYSDAGLTKSSIALAELVTKIAEVEKKQKT